MSKVEEAADWPDHRLAPLTGYPYYSIRAGDYRAILSWDRNRDVITVRAVAHRKHVYDRYLPP